MDNTFRSIRRQDGDTPHSPSPPIVMSKSTNTSQSGSHRATTGPTLQGRPTYAAVDRKAPSDQRPDSAVGTNNPAATSRREPRPINNQTTARPAAASMGRQVTTGQFDIGLDAQSRVGKSPLDADNTRNASVHSISSSKPSSISASKESRAAQGERITNSETTMSAGSMQLPVHRITNSPPSLNVLPSRALRENSSNTSLPVAAPGPEETRKRNESSHLQEDSRPSNEGNPSRPHAAPVDRADSSSVQPSTKPSTPYPPPLSPSERNAIRPHAGPINRTASSSIQPPTKSATHPPPFSSSETNATRPWADPVNRTASTSVQPPIKPSTPYPPPISSSERNTTKPHAELVNRTASSSIQPPIKFATPPPPFSSSETNATRPHADPVNRTASSSVQPSIKLSTPYPPSFSSNERNANRRLAEPVNRTASSSVQPPIKHASPSPPPFSSNETNTTRPHAEPVDRTTSVQPHAKPFILSPLDRPSTSISPSSSPQAPPLAKIASNRIHPPRSMLSYEPQTQFSEALSESPHPAGHPLLVDRENVRSDEQARKDPSAVSRRSPAPPEYIPATTEPPRQDHTDSSTIPQRPPKHIPTTTDISSRQDRGVTSATPNRPPIPAEHTAATVSPSFQDPKCASAVLPNLSVLPKHTPVTTDPRPPLDPLSQPVSVPGDLNGSKSGIQGNEGVAGGEPQGAQQHQAKPNPEGGNSVGILSSSPPDSDAGKSRDSDHPEKLVGNKVDARPSPARHLSTSIPHQSGRPTVGKGKAQQRKRGAGVAAYPTVGQEEEPRPRQNADPGGNINQPSAPTQPRTKVEVKEPSASGCSRWCIII